MNKREQSESMPPDAWEETATGRQGGIEVVLPDERLGDLSFTFKLPARESILASANRLLRFEIPPLRELKVYERLIKTHAVSAGLSKKTLAGLPFSFLETIYGRLWSGGAFPPNSQQDALLGLFLLVEEASEFRVEAMARQDICLVSGVDSMDDAEPFPERAWLADFLTTYGYRADFLAAELPEPSLPMAYLVCRRLSHPLPWAALLDSVQPEDGARYVRLARLKRVLVLLKAQPWAEQPITPETLPMMVEAMRGLLDSEPMRVLAKEATLPKPVRALVIVEGETENLLLPLFAEGMGLNFYGMGIELWPAGGKSNVAALYWQHARNLAIPIAIVLDQDATEVAEAIRPGLRSGDALFQIAQGEFEDLYDLDEVIRIINRNYQPHPPLDRASFQRLAEERQAVGRVQTLRAIWQAYGLGSFDKIEFARQAAEACRASETQEAMPPPDALCELIQTLVRVRNGGA